MDAHSVPVQLTKDAKQKHRVDLPLRVFSEKYYQHLTKLYETTGIDFVPENYSGSLSDYDESSTSSHPWGKTFFSYGNVLLGKLSLPLLFSPSLLMRCRTMTMLHDYFWLINNGKKHLRDGVARNLTFIEYLEKYKFSDDFIHSLIFPIVAGICTCSFESVAAYPAEILLRYLIERSLGGVRRAAHGTSDVVERLSRNCRVLINTPVRSVRYVDDEESSESPSKPTAQSNGHSSSNPQRDDAASPMVRVRSESTENVLPPKRGAVLVTDCNGNTETYNHVVIATQSNQCLRFLENPTQDQIKALSSVKYESSEVVLHTDASFMPDSRSLWRGVNFSSSSKRSMPMATIWMNYVQPSLQAPMELFQTWNPFESPEPSKVLGRGDFERPVVTFESLEGVKLLSKCQGDRNLWFCGSYVLDGMPLLENAVESAVEVCEKLGARPPWQVSKSEFAASGTKGASSSFGGVLFALFAFFVLVTLVSAISFFM